MGDLSASPQQAIGLGWIPLPALVLDWDGSAVAVNERWADLSPVPGDGQGWLEAVEPVFRPALLSTLRLAAATGEPGRADCLRTGPQGGRRSRWWWQPFPPGGLVVCVAVIDGGPAEGLLVAGDARDPLAREHTGASRSAGIPARSAATPQPTGRAGPLLDSIVNGIFTAGMALQAVMGLPLAEAAAERITEALRCLDEVVREVRDHILTEDGQQAQPGQPTRPDPDARERGELAAEHAAALRERVTQTAYALHLAAADTAALLERHDDLVEQPGRIDYPTEIKRWRVIADQAKQMAERWNTGM